MSTIIRKATYRDIPQMTALLIQLFTIEQDFVPNPEKQSKGLKLLLENKSNACVLVADTGFRIVGMITAQILISTSEGSYSAILEDLVVDKSYRRKGIGKQLMHEIEKWAKDNNISRLQLLADKNNNNALEFYKAIQWDSTQLICLRKYIKEYDNN
jgi:ribosomal protein S18 acetylase RimI-like enzyme